MKKLLALVLALVMTLGLATVATNAAYPDAAGIDLKEAVDVLSAVGVFQGDEKGNFSPKANLDRAAAAKLIAYLDLGEKAAETLPAVQVFNDVPASHWAAKYISYCYQNGLIAGVGNNNYNPTGALTGYAFGKMLLCVLGYDANVEGFTGNTWSINVAKYMNDIELADGVDGALSAILTREQAAQYCLNALKANVVEYADKGTSIEINGAKIATGASKAEDKTAAKNEKYESIDKDTIDSKDVVQLGEKLFGVKLACVDGEKDKLGRPTNNWYYNADAKKLNDTTGDEDNIVAKAVESADKVFVNDKDLKWKTDMATTLALDSWFDEAVEVNKVTINGQSGKTSADLYALSNHEGLVVEAYETDEDDVYDFVAYEYTLYQIDEVDTDVDSSDKKAGVTAIVTLNDGSAIKDKDFEGYNAATYKEDAYIIAIVDGDEVLDSALAESSDGTITATKNIGGTDGYVLLDGTKYYLAETCNAELFDRNLANVKAGSDAFTLYFDNNNYVVGIELVEGSDPTIEDVYYVNRVYDDGGVMRYGEEVVTYSAQLVKVSDGKITEITLENTDKNASEKTEYKAEKWEGKLVTISDKKWSANGAEGKANNNKFDLKTWENDDWYVNSPSKTDIKKDDSRLGSYRLNSSTKYVVIGGDPDELEVNLYTGGVSYKAADMDTLITIDAAKNDKDSNVVAYAIIDGKESESGTTFDSDNVVFVKSSDKEQGDGFWNQTVYLPDGSKETWQIDENSVESDGSISSGFYAYDTNSDGYVELDNSDVKTLDTATEADWDEDTGVVVAYVLKDGDYYEDEELLTVGKLHDIKVGGAAFVDAHSKDDNGTNYTKSITSLAKLADLVADGKVQNATISMSVAKDGAVVIILTKAEKA